MMAARLGGLCGWGEGDCVAKGFQLPDVVSLLSIRGEVLGEVVGSQVGECCLFVSEQVPDDDEDRASDGDKCAFFASPFGDAPIPFA